MLVLKYLKNKKNGTFVDIGCAYPTLINNTFLLEKEFGWWGLSIDLVSRNDLDGGTWESKRPNSKRLLANALEIDYEKVFVEFGLPSTIDFLSLDLEPPDITTECLFRIPFNKFKFNFIAFETDEYRNGGEERRDRSREYFSSIGYILVESKNRQDDFYLHNTCEIK